MGNAAVVSLLSPTLSVILLAPGPLSTCLVELRSLWCQWLVVMSSLAVTRQVLLLQSTQLPLSLSLSLFLSLPQRLVVNFLSYPRSQLTLIIHMGTNYVMQRQSIILHDQLESLALTIQSLSKICVFSGPIPAPFISDEHFSCLFALHEWLKCFCTATGLGFICNFDCFWTSHALYKPDGLHLNTIGTRQLAQNFIRHTAFNSD